MIKLHQHGQYHRLSRTASRCGLCGQMTVKTKWRKATGRRNVDGSKYRKRGTLA